MVTIVETDSQLIAEYNAGHSEEAFAALVRQHISLVFATALRQAGDAQAAEDITQNVFVALARSCGKLGSHPTIAGWLYRTTLNKSREWIRSELRRRKRESIAINLQLNNLKGDSVWAPLVPLLDEALLEVPEPDRLAVVLHYMEGRPFDEVGMALGTSPDAARKRASRCLDDLTHFFRRRGFAMPAGALAAPLFALSSQPAPAGLAASVASAAVHAAASPLTFIPGALKLMAWTNTKKAMVASLWLFAAAGATTGFTFRHSIGHWFELERGKSAIARHAATPIDLTGVIAKYGVTSQRLAAPNGYSGWRAMPSGFQVFNHVPFQIDGEFSLWGEKNATRLHMIFPEKITDIAVNREFATLYLLHCAFFMAPDSSPVFGVVFHYGDELAVTNELRFGDDVLGWVGNSNGPVIVPTGPNSKLAWAGGAWSSTDKSPMRLCMSAIQNPMPYVKVTSIDLYSCKGPSAGVIMAMTVGKAGLME